MLKQLRSRGRGSEVRETDECILLAQPLVPALGDAGLDGDARRVTKGRQAIGFGLFAEQLEATASRPPPL